MFSTLSRSSTLLVNIGARNLSTIPVKQVASVLKLNVGNEANAIKIDAAMKKLGTMMKAHPGYSHATRYVCKTEWAYEMSYIFKDLDSFKAWKTSKVRDQVHTAYLAALKDAGIKEESVYSGARVHDEWR
jgi:antibiotic biosynthesis monooxygenase (ABM) superfamily enzyme